MIETIHPRTKTVVRAKLELEDGFLKLVIRHKLTFGEALYLLSQVAIEYSRGLIKQERHGKNSKKSADQG